MTEKYQIPELSLIESARREGIKKFTVAAGITISGKLLLVRRAPDDFLGGLYEFAGGGVEEGESFEQALVRETKQETGLNIISVLGTFKGFDYRDENNNVTRQFNFAVEVENGEVSLNSAEHDAVILVGPNDLERLTLTKEVRKAAQDFFNEFGCGS